MKCDLVAANITSPGLTLQRVESWGRLAQEHLQVTHPAFLDQAQADICTAGLERLALGCGRSYGDICLNRDGRLIATAFLDHIIEADWERGVIRAEAGLTLGRLLRVCVPRGWFLPTTPGTKSVSLGGAVASDVHGKNHESAGTFGCHIIRLGLYRSTGECLELSPDQNAELFSATIGGLGLTGLIAWVEIQLMPIQSAYFEVEALPTRDLDAFFKLSAESQEWPYTIAWVDGLANGAHLGRGLFIRGRHATTGGLAVHRNSRWSVPFDAPSQLMNPIAIRAFNFLYRKAVAARTAGTLHYDDFLYPLDRIARWNRLYGRRGFFQHQSVIPAANAASAIRTIFNLMTACRQAPVNAGLKTFGARSSPGIMSFPCGGVTLGLEFPNNGDVTRRMVARMAEIAFEKGGRIYPAKDAVMSGKIFRASYPAWETLEKHRDPAINSDFWRRVTAPVDRAAGE